MNQAQAKTKIQYKIKLFYLLAIGLCLGALFILSSLATSSNNKKITAVTSLTSNEQHSVSLPARWQINDDSKNHRRFIINVLLSSSEKSDFSLYIPFYERDIALTINGHKYQQKFETDRLFGPIGLNSAVIDIPFSMLKIGNNEIAIDVFNNNANIGSLSHIEYGRHYLIKEGYNFKHFLNNQFKILLIGLQLFLLTICLISIYYRHKDIIFYWLLLSLVSVISFTIAPLFNNLNIANTLLPTTFILSTFASYCFFAFTIHLTELHTKINLPAVGLVIFVTIFLIYYFKLLSLYQLAVYLIIPSLAIITLLTILVLGHNLAQQFRGDIAAMFVGMVFFFFALGHDTAVRFGLIYDGVFFAPISRFLIIFGIAFFLMKRQIDFADNLDKAGEVLKSKLLEKETELNKIFMQQAKALESSAMDAERSRITTELHDGVAGYLTTIVALAETDTAPPDKVKEVAKNALQDLRLVISAMSLDSGDLNTALSVFREKCFDPLSHTDIQLHWSMESLPKNLPLGNEHILNIIRSMQEILNNSIKHGSPTSISITGELTQHRYQISITNLGGKHFNYNGAGLGLPNIAKRIAKLPQGQVEFTSVDEGACVVFSFDLSPSLP